MSGHSRSNFVIDMSMSCVNRSVGRVDRSVYYVACVIVYDRSGRNVHARQVNTLRRQFIALTNNFNIDRVVC